MKKRTGTRLITFAVAGLLAATATATGAVAAPPRVAAATSDSPVQTLKDDLNQQLVRALQDPVARRVFVAAMVNDGQADLTTVLSGIGSRAGDEFSRYAADANLRVIGLKGLDGIGGSVLQAHLADPVMARRLAAGTLPLLATTPAEAVKTVPAYGLDGSKVELDYAAVPDVPVVVVGLDEATISPYGMKVLSAGLVSLGLSSDVITPGRETRPPVPDAGRSAGTVKSMTTMKTAGGTSYTATRMDQIRLADDEEPFWKGPAEIYGLVLGQGLNGLGRTDVVNMPYLDYDHTWYFPGQQLINWSNFKWNAVDLLLMEQDDSTNYKGIATSIVTFAGALFGGAAYTPLINAVLNAFPDGWFTDDDDYVDSFYMLTKTRSGLVTGASSNAKIVLTPVTVTSN